MQRTKENKISEHSLGQQIEIPQYVRQYRYVCMSIILSMHMCFKHQHRHDRYCVHGPIRNQERAMGNALEDEITEETEGMTYRIRHLATVQKM